jgi:hypothetical protein
MSRAAVTTPCSGDARPQGGPEQERGVRRIAPNNQSLDAAANTSCFDAPENKHRSTCDPHHGA